MEDVLPLPEGIGDGSAVTVLWRPGCPFCALLLRRLERTGLVFDRVDIWEHPAAAAWVRSVADGNETVPTVRVAGGSPERAVALVNPSPTQVLDVLARIAPGAMPGTGGPASGWRGWLRGRRDRARGRGARR